MDAVRARVGAANVRNTIRNGKHSYYANALSLLEPKLMKNSLAFSSWKGHMDAVIEQTRFTQVDFGFILRI